MGKKSIVVVATLTLLMVVAAPALAGAPVTNPNTTYDFDWVDQKDWRMTALCEFDVYSSGNVSQVEKVYFDKEGLLKRFEVHARGNIDTYAPDLGTSVKSRFALHLSERRIEGTEDWSQTWTGNGWNIHESGSGNGAVVHDRGRVTLLWQDYDWQNNPPISWAGPRDHHDVLLNQFDVDQAVCDALAS